MKFLILIPLYDYWLSNLPDLEKEFPNVNFRKSTEKSERAALLNEADAVLAGALSIDDINNSPRLKAIFVPFTGLDNFPVGEISRRNILIFNTHANAKYVAEKAVSLALTLLGRNVEFHENLKQGRWNLFQLTELNYWTTIQGKSCAILGFGEIGKKIAEFLKPFGCKIIAFKKNISKDDSIALADEVTNDIKKAIEYSDIIFVCLPLTSETKGIINKDILKKMKGKYIINVGRGLLINEEAFYLALKNKILAGAAIDVWYNYPGRTKPEPVFPSKFPFHELDNVILSPHKSGLTKESIEGMIDDTINNIRAYLKRILSG